MRVEVRVIPRAARNQILVRDGVLTLRVTAPPVDSAANEAVQETLAEACGVPKRAIRIVRGETSRTKTIEINGDETAVRQRLAALGWTP